MGEDAQLEKAVGRRRLVAMLVVVAAVAIAAAVIFMLPRDVRIMLVGRTIDHCPDSELSCPSQGLGLLHLLMIPAVLLLMWFDDD